MKVRVYNIDKTNAETLRCECYLSECYPDDQDGYLNAREELLKSGRYWEGGGAMPLTLLMRVS